MKWIKSVLAWIKGHPQEVQEVLDLTCGICGKIYPAAEAELESILGVCKACIKKAKS